MKVSIIVPLHNSRKYISECMDSIINQTLDDIEIICIDSGSDETSKIIQSYACKDKRIKYIYDSNSSYGYKINKGIVLAKGKYIAIVESDDYIRNDMMQILYELAENNNVDFVKSDFKKCIDLNNERIEFGIEQLPNLELYNRVINIQEEPVIKEYIGYNIWVGLYLKEFLVSNSIFLNESEGASYQDTGFSVLITLIAQRVYFSNHQLYRYRIDNNDSSVKSQLKYKCIINEFHWLKEQMNIKNLKKSEDIIFYKDKKLISYLWNFQRLLPEYQIKFLNEIKEEMKNEFPDDSFYISSASSEKLQIINILKGSTEEAVKLKQNGTTAKRYLENALKIISNKKSVVIFGAGVYGKALIEMIDILQKGKVVAICDNDIKKHDKELFKLKIEDPRNAALKFKDAFFIIANKEYYYEIRKQLEHYGIQPDNIYAIKEIPSKYMLLEAIAEIYC